MKRSEMEEHIQAMTEDAVENRQYSGETDEKYYKRHAKYILEMLLGFGMLPPLSEEEYNHMDNYDREIANQALVYYKWDEENEKK